MKKNNIQILIGILVALLFFGVFLLTKNLPEKVLNENPLTPENSFNEEKTIDVVQDPAEIIIETKTATTTQTQPKTPEVTQVVEEGSESVTVLIDKETLVLKFYPNTSFYEVLMQAVDQGKLILKGRNYSGLGFFVTDIGTLHASNGDYLIYYINGEKATVGVSSYILKDGDVIEWRLE